MEIRYEKPGDTAAIRSVHQAAFETGAEADLVDVLRDKKAHIISMVTEKEDRINKITIEKLIANYSVLLLDAYGVLVHSSGALPGAARLIDSLNLNKKPYYIVTNDADKSLQPTYYLDSLSL